ncbi:MAG: hypothetical protein ACUVWZ_04735 [Anaerolineae bacterium]
MRKSVFFLVSIALVAGPGLTLAGCGPSPTEGASPLPTASLELSPVQTPEGPGELTQEPELDPHISGLVDQAKEDLSQRIQIPSERIAVQSVEAVQWRDSSLGCPEPGMYYLMVITPGYRIRLEADGRIYEYHTSETRVVFCENPEPPL